MKTNLAPMTRRSAPGGLAAKVQKGFTLVELMVGVLLGMITVAIIAQVFAVSESKKRTTTSGADAQVNGALALYAVQRETQISGYGLTSQTGALGCKVNYQYSSGAPGSFTLAPVLIEDGANGSNIVTLLRSTKNTFAVAMKITENHPADAYYYMVQSSLGVSQGDLMIAVTDPYTAAAGCSVVQVHDGASKTLNATTIPVAGGSGGDWNQQSILPSTGYSAGAYLLNMGTMSLRKYSINATTNALQVSELSGTDGKWTDPMDAFQQVVVFRAMYGKDTNNDGSVDTYDNTTPTSSDLWKQVLAIRVVMVARSAQYEKEEITTKDLQWDVGTTASVAGSSSCSAGKCVTVSLAFLGADWKHYRYKIYDTVVPLRNVLWNS